MLKLKKDWRRVHAFNASASPHPPALQLNASRIAYIAQIFALGDVEVRACASATRVEAKGVQLLHSFDTGDDLKRWHWHFCRTGNTSLLSFLVDGVFRRGFSGYWEASRMRVFGV